MAGIRVRSDVSLSDWMGVEEEGGMKRGGRKKRGSTVQGLPRLEWMLEVKKDPASCFEDNPSRSEEAFDCTSNSSLQTRALLINGPSTNSDVEE